MGRRRHRRREFSLMEFIGENPIISGSFFLFNTVCICMAVGFITASLDCDSLASKGIEAIKTAAEQIDLEELKKPFAGSNAESSGSSSGSSGSSSGGSGSSPGSSSSSSGSGGSSSGSSGSSSGSGSSSSGSSSSSSGSSGSSSGSSGSSSGSSGSSSGSSGSSPGSSGSSSGSTGSSSGSSGSSSSSSSSSSGNSGSSYGSSGSSSGSSGSSSESSGSSSGSSGPPKYSSCGLLSPDERPANTATDWQRSDELPDTWECGDTPTKPDFTIGGKIIGGGEAVQGSWPWIVAMGIIKMTQRGMTIKHYCAGTFISPKHVLTAAHCFMDDPKLKIKDHGVLFYAHDVKTWKGAQAMQIVNIRYHPKTNAFGKLRPYPAYDFALITVEGSILEFNLNINVVCLPKLQEKPVQGEAQNCWVHGWGHTDGTGADKKLKQLRVEEVDIETCREESGRKQLEEHIISCFRGHDKKATPCSGDSGNPFVCQDSSGKWKIFGILSFLQIKGGYCQIGSITGTANVASNMEWICCYMPTAEACKDVTCRDDGTLSFASNQHVYS